MILARLAMGTGRLPPCAATIPTPGTPTTASAWPAHLGRGGTPGRTRTGAAENVTVTAGSGRSNCTTTKAAAAVKRMVTTATNRPATRKRNLLPVRARGRGGECAGRPAAYARVPPPPDAGALADSLAFSRVLAREQRLPDDARIERMPATPRIKLRHTRFAARRGSPAGAGRRTSVV